MTTGYYIDRTNQNGPNYVVVKKESSSILSNYKLFGVVIDGVEQDIQPRLYYMDDIQFVSFALPNPLTTSDIPNVKIKILGWWKEPVLTNAFTNGTSYSLDSVSEYDYTLEAVKALVEDTEKVRYVVHRSDRYYFMTNVDNIIYGTGEITYEYNIPITYDVVNLVDNTKVLSHSNKIILFYTNVKDEYSNFGTQENFDRLDFESKIGSLNTTYDIMVLTKNAVNYTATFYSSIDINNTTVYYDPPFSVEEDEIKTTTQKSTPIFKNDPNATTYVNDINFLYTWNLDERLIVSNPTGKTNTGKPVYDSEGINDYSAELLPSKQSEITQLNRYYDFVSKKPIIYWKDTYSNNINYQVRYKNSGDTDYIINPDTNAIDHLIDPETNDLFYEKLLPYSVNSIGDPVFTHKCILSLTTFNATVDIQIQLLITEPSDFGILLESNTYTRTYDALTNDEKNINKVLTDPTAELRLQPTWHRTSGSMLRILLTNISKRPDMNYELVDHSNRILIQSNLFMKQEIQVSDYRYEITIPPQEYYLENHVKLVVWITDFLSHHIYIRNWIKVNYSIQLSTISTIYNSENNSLTLNWKSNIYFAMYTIESNGEIIVQNQKLATSNVDATVGTNEQEPEPRFMFSYSLSTDNLIPPIKVIATFDSTLMNSTSTNVRLLLIGYENIEDRLTKDPSVFGSIIKYKEIYNTQTYNLSLYVEYESSSVNQTVYIYRSTTEITGPVENMDDPLNSPLNLLSVSESSDSEFKYIEIQDIQNYPPINDLLVVDETKTYYFKLTDGQILYNSNNTIKITPIDIISDTTKYQLIITNDDSSQDNTYSKYIYRSTDLSGISKEFQVNNVNYTFQFETEYLSVEDALRLIGETDSTTSNLIVREYNDTVLDSTFTSDIESKYFSISNIDIQVNLQDEGYFIDIKFDSWLGGQYNISIDDEVITSRNTILPNSPPEIGTIFELSTEASPATVLNTFEVVQIPEHNGEYILLKLHGQDLYMRHKDHICEINSYSGNLNDFWWKFDGQYIESPYGGSGSYLVYDNQLKIREKPTTPTTFIFNILYGKHVISYGEQEGESVVDFQEIGIENRQLSISKVILDKSTLEFNNIDKEQFSFADFDISTQKSQIKINFIYVEGINIVLDIDDNNTDKKSIVIYNLYKNNSFNRVKRFELSSTASNKLRISKFDLSLQLNDSLDLREENILGFEKYKGELFFIKINPIYNLRIERGKTDSDGNYNNNIYSFIFDDDKIEDESAVNLYLYNLYKDDVLIKENEIKQVIEVMEYNDVNMYGIWRIEKRSNIDLVLENAGTIEIKKPNAPKNIFVFKETNGDLTHKLIFDSDEFFSNSTFKVFIRFSSSADDQEEISYLSGPVHSFKGQHGTTIKIQEISYLGHESDITDTLTLRRSYHFSSLTATFDDIESDFILSWF